MPGYDIFYATWETFDEVRSPTRRIEIVEHVGTVVFNLRLQDIAQRRTRTQAAFARPNPLDILVITIGKKRPFSSLINGQKDVRRRLSKIQKCVNLTRKRRTILGQFTYLRTQGGIVSGILEEPHKLCIPIVVSRYGATQPMIFEEVKRNCIDAARLDPAQISSCCAPSAEIMRRFRRPAPT